MSAWRAPSILAAASLATEQGRTVTATELYATAAALPNAYPLRPPTSPGEAVTDLFADAALSVWGVLVAPARVTTRRPRRPVFDGEAAWLAREARRHGVVLTLDPDASAATLERRSSVLPLLTRHGAVDELLAVLADLQPFSTVGRHLLAHDDAGHLVSYDRLQGGQPGPAVVADHAGRVACPHCRRAHWHGPGTGHRVADCPDGAAGYVVVAPGDSWPRGGRAVSAAPAFDCAGCGRRIGKTAGHYQRRGAPAAPLCVRCRSADPTTGWSSGTRAGAAWQLGLWPTPTHHLDDRPVGEQSAPTEGATP